MPESRFISSEDSVAVFPLFPFRPSQSISKGCVCTPLVWDHENCNNEQMVLEEGQLLQNKMHHKLKKNFVNQCFEQAKCVGIG